MNSPMLASTNTAPGQPRISDSSAIARMAADIAFLQDRINLMKTHRVPNRSVLQTYTGMLARRKAALALLLNES